MEIIKYKKLHGNARDSKTKRDLHLHFDQFFGTSLGRSPFGTGMIRYRSGDPKAERYYIESSEAWDQIENMPTTPARNIRKIQHKKKLKTTKIAEMIRQNLWARLI